MEWNSQVRTAHSGLKRIFAFDIFNVQVISISKQIELPTFDRVGLFGIGQVEVD